MHCRICNQPMPNERAEFLMSVGKPVLCMACASERPATTFMDYSHKTAPTLVVVHGKGEALRMAQRCYRRAR
jgi:hypothetical protein